MVVPVLFLAEGKIEPQTVQTIRNTSVTILLTTGTLRIELNEGWVEYSDRRCDIYHDCSAVVVTFEEYHL